MTARGADFSPQAYARAGGLLYLYIIIAAMFAEAFVRSKLIISGDASTTAANILAHETLFGFGLAADVLNVSVDIGVALILYALLRPVDRNLALLAAWLRVAFDVIYAVCLLFQFVALRILEGGTVDGFDPHQTQGLVLLAMKLHAAGYLVGLVFFGFGLLVLGYLIWKSDYLPRFIGALLLIAGTGYLINSFARFLAPPVADALFPWSLLPGFIAELALCLWLLIKGVNLAKWQERARAA
ncbi:MAG TPA: DUF4386 domain-containing protein [Gammaproteobacteria bacterium]|nr:DUF4386 domain-containing protein [Gammaproteobacteria bacterium]